MSRGVDSTEKNSDFPKEVSSPQSHLQFISMSMIPPSPKTKVFFEPITSIANILGLLIKRREDQFILTKRKSNSNCLPYSVQFSSVAQSCPTLCNPMNRSTPGLPVHHQLPDFTETHVHRVSDAIQPSHPLSSPSPLVPNPSQHQSLFQ